jgi:hypothetical protein
MVVWAWMFKMTYTSNLFRRGQKVWIVEKMKDGAICSGRRKEFGDYVTEKVTWESGSGNFVPIIRETRVEESFADRNDLFYWSV